MTFLRAKGLFKEMETTITSYNPQSKLWDYQLLKDGNVLLYIRDCADLSVTPMDGDLAELKDLGVSTDEWQECK